MELRTWVEGRTGQRKQPVRSKGFAVSTDVIDTVNVIFVKEKEVFSITLEPAFKLQFLPK